MTTITPRISSTPSASNTGRVATSGGNPEIPPVFSNDTWGGTWGGTWGRTWFTATALVPASGIAPSLDVTPRIAGAPTANNTKRVG